MDKRILLIFSFVILLLFTCCSEKSWQQLPEPSKPHDFMNADWGMSQSKVQKSQLPNIELYADDTTMLYEVTKAYDTIEVFFTFLDDQLVSGECRIEMGQEVWSKRVPELIESYMSFREEIIDIYGAAIDEEYMVWLDMDPEYIEDDDMHNLYYNRLEYLSEWETETSRLTLRLYYKDRDFKLVFEAFPI